MESVIYLLVIAPAVMFLILKFDKKQSQKMNKVLRETKNIQPLFLLRSAENKLIALNTKLYGSMAIQANGAFSGQIEMNEGARQVLTSQLSQLINDYNNGQISLITYNDKLGQLIENINHVRLMNFEQIKS
jgi:hypothetical protein